jgi:hypothetical protein
MEIEEKPKKAQCTLVWEGTTSGQSTGQKKKTFDKWKVVDIRTETEAKRLLQDKNMVHLWNMVINLDAQRAVGENEEDIKKLLV